LKRLFVGDDRLRIFMIVEKEPSLYWSGLAGSLAPLPIEERHAVVFIHGYNVSFDDAALRAAQIGFDLGIEGVMAFFSWPSKGTLGGYPADEASIEASEDLIADYLVDVGQRSGASALHVIAHSMGNRGLLRAINRIAADSAKRAGIPFGQFLLAAPDVDRDVFLRMSSAYRQVAQRTTLYVSTRDRAIEASKWLHDYSRVGLVPPVAILPGIDTVEVQNVDLSLIGHGYVAEARGVLSDMHSLIRRDVPPDERFGLRPSDTETGQRYWIIGA
jgi:esterase/lipase superfamily enzyme